MTSDLCAEFTAPYPEVTGSGVKIELKSHSWSAYRDGDNVFEVILNVLGGDFGYGSRCGARGQS